MDNEPSIVIPASDVIYKGTKSVIASLTTGIAVLTTFGIQISDGVFTWSEGGALLGAIAGAVTTVLGVWRVPNEIKSLR